MPQALFADEYITISLHPEIRLVRYTRAAKPFPSIDIIRSHQAALPGVLAAFSPNDHALLIDIRSAPPRNDEAFEVEVTRLMAALVTTSPAPSSFNSLIGTCSTGTSGGHHCIISGAYLSGSAGLGPLATNPPGTTDTHALLPGSIALGAGSVSPPNDAMFTTCGRVDQRGVERAAGCDIGAYEAP